MVVEKQEVQLFTEKPDSTIAWPVQELKALAKTAELAPGTSEEITLKIPVND